MDKVLHKRIIDTVHNKSGVETVSLYEFVLNRSFIQCSQNWNELKVCNCLFLNRLQQFGKVFKLRLVFIIIFCTFLYLKFFEFFIKK